MQTNLTSRTVGNLSPSELDVYRKALRHRKRLRTLDSVRLTRAQKVARKAASILRKEFGVERIVLFGSVANSKLFHSRSDVDIAVWGLDDHIYFRAVASLLGIDSEISVDLITYETASSAIQEAILRDGKPL